ncbi:MAP7 domain-containing protein 3 isoform X5 [Pyxicephalus adspersus]|uniref:MAP7 domain-containing protein 3 isoform X5 n=1 Tax=Pyxicephalus adspersus TaxID=30357 RepID=UPI003B5BA14C
MRSPGRIERAAIPGEGKMADGSGKLKELREQMVAAAQALADERRSQAGSSPIPVHSTASGKTTKPVIDGPALRTDERQRLARERREEKERLNAAKEKELIEKEKKAKLQYEKQMEEKQKKLEEQKIKDEQKRTAAEGKRKQKLQEEKERREATLRRTLERSSQLDQRQKRWSWGGSGEGEKHTNKRSTSASNLKQADSVVNKRLSSSSATLQTSEKAHRPQTSPLDSNLISRLLAPTQSSLARSKSAATLSADGKESPASATTISTPPSVSKGPMRSRSIDRMKSPQSAASGASSSESSQKPGHEKSSPPSIGKRPPSPNVTLNRRSPSPTSTPKRAPSPTLEKKASSSLTQKNRPPSPSLLKQRPPSPTVTHKPIPIQRPSLTPTVLNATKKISDSEAKPKEKPAEGSSTEPKNVQASEKEATTGKTKDESSNKTVSGSTTAEEAAKILAEKRRLAREQREREEKERIQRQQEEKIRQEEMARKAEEEKERLKEEAKLLEEKRKLESEAEERKALEEKLRRDLEEQERLAELQQQKEEAEARALEEAEKQRQEREKIMQQNMQERLERKKRIEEIMKRTRKGDQADAKNEERSEEDEENFSLDKNIHGEVNGTDISDADGPQEVILTPNSASSDFLSQNAVVEESNDLFMNGDEPDIDQQLNGHVLDTAPKEEFSQVISDTNNLNVDQTHLSEHITNTNGKPSSWTFEEIIDLEIHSKNSSLSESTDDCNTVLIEAATVPPKLAFEEGHVNSLSLAIETATEI